MKIKITDVIKQIDGIKPIENPENKKAMTLKDVCINALLASDQKDEAKQKFTDYETFKKLRDSNKEVELSAEEISRIKMKIGNIYPALVLGQAWEKLEGKNEK